MGNNFEMELNIVIDWGVDLCEIIQLFYMVMVLW